MPSSPQVEAFGGVGRNRQVLAVFQEGMIRIVLLAMVVAVGLIATGCRSCPLGGKGGQAAPAASGEERRTVTFVQRSEADVREHYATWAREGWAVESLSAPLPQSDGTILRRAELARAQAPASTSK